jgi:hypothetical protein
VNNLALRSARNGASVEVHGRRNHVSVSSNETTFAFEQLVVEFGCAGSDVDFPVGGDSFRAAEDHVEDRRRLDSILGSSGDEL